MTVALSFDLILSLSKEWSTAPRLEILDPSTGSG
jgi:hypothetical protein